MEGLLIHEVGVKESRNHLVTWAHLKGYPWIAKGSNRARNALPLYALGLWAGGLWASGLQAGRPAVVLLPSWIPHAIRP